MKVGEVTNILSGFAFDSMQFNETGDGFPLIRIRDVGKSMTKTFYSGDFKKDYIIKKGDFLIGMDGNFRLSEWKGQDALLNQRVCKIIPDENIVSKRYLIHFLPKQLQQIEDSTSFATVKHLSVKKIRDIKIPLPPLYTQKKIAAILDKADALRQNDKKILEKYDELAQSVFLEMFGDPVRNEKGWENEKLTNLVKISGGGTPSKRISKYFTGDIPWISPKDMKFDFITDSIDKITNTAIQNSSTKLIPKESVLVVVRSGILKNYLPVAINLIPVALNQDMKAFQCNNNIDPYFLMYLLRVLSPIILQTVRGTTADNISSDVLKKLILILPSIELQRKFRTSILKIEQQSILSKSSLQKSEELFQSLLQRAFRGELVN